MIYVVKSFPSYNFLFFCVWGGISRGKWCYTFVTFIDAREELSVGACNICLTLLCLVVGEIWSEEFPYNEICAFFLSLGGVVEQGITLCKVGVRCFCKFSRCQRRSARQCLVALFDMVLSVGW